MFKKVSLSKGIECPARCIAIAVIQQAFVDASSKMQCRESALAWLRGDGDRDFWLDCAEVNHSAFNKPVTYWFPGGNSETN